MEYGLQRITEISSQVKAKIAEVADFLRVKAQQNVVLGSIFKDINGLVYFIHINRNNGRVIIPTLDSNDKRGKLIKKQVKSFNMCFSNNLIKLGLVLGTRNGGKIKILPTKRTHVDDME